MLMKVGVDYIGVGCGAIVINEKGEVLLLRRSTTSRTDPGKWCRPGGQVEFGESVTDAVERETMEETGIVVRAVRPLEFTDDRSEDASKHWIALGYLAEHVSGEPVNVEPDKHDAIGWFPLDRLPENLATYTKNAIDVYLDQKR
jgi:8-oxo-dGTP diphosphatase